MKKPGRKAKPEDWQACRLAVKQHTLSQRRAGAASHLRQALDGAGGENKILVLAGDGSFRNRTCSRAQGCGVVPARPTGFPPLLRHPQVHPRAGAPR